MKLKNLKLGILVLLAVIFVFDTACSQDKKTAAKTTSDLSPLVLEVKSISPSGENEPVNFTWIENGKEKKLSDFLKGKITFMNFWGTWCPPCRAEIPHLIDLSKKYESQGFQIVGIALERSEENAMTLVSDYVKRANINYRNFPSRAYAEEFSKKFGAIQYVPTTFVVGRDGKILETIVGGRDHSTFESIINKYINN